MHVLNKIAFSICLAGLICGCASSSSAQEAPAPTSLKEAARGRILMGTASGPGELSNPRQLETILKHFELITPANEMKMDALQRVKGVFTFERGDQFIAFVQKNPSIQIIGHTLLWHQQAPAWMFQDAQGNPLPREEGLANLKTHITTVLTHYKGKIKGWDVVNEAIGDSEEYLRNTPALKSIGPDYIVKAFQFAHEADPDVELYYNDYNIEADYKRPKVIKLIRELKAAGVRLDAIGVQGHWLIESPTLELIDKGLTELIAEGYPIHITEMDIDPLPRRNTSGADLSATEREGNDPYRNGMPDDIQQKFAKRYADVFKIFLKHPQVTRVTFWGTTDGNSWLNNWPVRGRLNHPLLFDRQYQPKPAYVEVMKVLSASKQ